MPDTGWALEVVRGRGVGRVYPLRPGALVLGNALDGIPGIDLGPEEAGASRTMAARQARLDCSAASLALRDLDSPGGTFVNRQRILAGESRPLQPGDLIQLGGVQLRVVAATATATAAPARPAPAAAAATVPASASIAPFRLASGAVCRSFDDFLTVSSQRWADLRDELVSGRLATYLKLQGRSDLLPPDGSIGSADERLDAWLGRLPSTRAAVRDLDVHPAALKVRAVAGGGVTRQKITVTNTGYRLLRSTVRVEPSSVDWLVIDPRFAGKPFTTAEQTEVPLDVRIPESVASPLRASLVLESDGGTRRIEVALEPSVATASIPDDHPAAPDALAAGLAARLEATPLARRLLAGGAAAAGLRLLLAVGDGLSSALGIPDPDPPALAGSALVLAAIGALLAARSAVGRGEPRDIPACAFAGAFAGLFLAAIAVALGRSVEPLLGEGLSRSAPLATALWLILGVLAGWGSTLVTPPPRPIVSNPGASP